MYGLVIPDDLKLALEETAGSPHIVDMETCSDEELASELMQVDGALVSGKRRLANELLDAAERLSVISNFGVGYDNVDVGHATSLGILICNTPGVLDGAVADLTFGLMIGLARRLPQNEEHLRSGAWKAGLVPALGSDIRGKTLGIIGLGRVGMLVAKTAQAFDMKIIYFNPSPNPLAQGLGIQHRERESVFREADFLSVHLRLDALTRRSIGERELGLMKPTAFLINTSRGAVVDQDALVQSLRAREIAGAGLDVMDPEPLAPDHPLCRLENVILLPHVGSATTETRMAMAAMAIRNLIAGVTGGTPEALVNPEVLESGRRAERLERRMRSMRPH
jgi:glyoxylate reductase